MKTPLTAILTTVAVLAATLAVPGCGGKAATSSSAQPATSSTPATTTPTTTTTTHKHQTKPGY